MQKIFFKLLIKPKVEEHRLQGYACKVNLLKVQRYFSYLNLSFGMCTNVDS